MSSASTTLHLPTPADTELLGIVLAATLPKTADAAVILHLQGELGAGKTTCARGLLRARGITGPVRSPTYTLIETYQTESLSFVHIDLYRLTDFSEVEQLGVRELVVPGTLILIEWPEKGAAAVPTADVRLVLSYTADVQRPPARVANLVSLSTLGHEWLRHLGDDTRIDPYVHNMT